MKKYAITITRQFGSLGRPIAKVMAEKLGIDYYDRDIVEEASKNLNLSVDTIQEEEEKARSIFRNMMYPLGRGTNETQDRIFIEQQKIIGKLVEDHPQCIIVGRCSDYILRNMEHAIHIYIYASMADRLRNCVEELMMTEEEARKTLPAVDKARDAYHKHYAGYLPSDPDSKHIMINSSILGVEGTADFLVDFIKKKFGEGDN